MIVAKMGAYSDHPPRINLYNLDSNTFIRSEVIFSDTNVTGCLDGDYCNAIDLFCFLSAGTAATTYGKRTLYYCSADYDGVNNLLKYKVLLNFDGSFFATKRQRY